MVTKLKRYSVSLPHDLETFIEKEAEFNRRPISNQIIYILDMYLKEKKKELDFFRPQLREAGQSQEPQHFVTPSPPVIEHLYKTRENLDREKT